MRKYFSIGLNPTGVAPETANLFSDALTYLHRFYSLQWGIYCILSYASSNSITTEGQNSVEFTLSKQTTANPSHASMLPLPFCSLICNKHIWKPGWTVRSRISYCYPYCAIWRNECNGFKVALSKQREHTCQKVWSHVLFTSVSPDEPQRRKAKL